MADDPRYGSQRYTQAPASTGQDDPLAELARLIGRDDALMGAGREGARGRQPDSPRDVAQTSTPDWLARSRWPGESMEDQGRREDGGADRPHAQPNHDASLSRRLRAAAERWPDESDFREAPAETADSGSSEDDSAYRGRSRAEPEPEPESDPYRTAAYDGRYDPQPQEHQEYAQRDAGEPQMAAEYDSDLYGHGGDEGDYEEEPRRRRRSGFLTVAAVLGIVVIGTAISFGYRAWTGSAASSGPPPTIKADTGPTKVVPAPSGDAQQNKMIYDRIGEKIQSSTDRVVSREEQPLELREMSRPSSPRGAMPSPSTPGTVMIGAQPPASAGSPVPAAGAGPNEPKKVHTITIRPDQPIGLPDAGEASASPPAYAMPPPAQAVPVRPGAGSASQPTASRATSPAKPAAKPAGNAPLAINTRGSAADAAETPAPPRTAPAPAPVRTAALPGPVEAGNYVVQISSQRSEAEAQSSFRTLQAKYPNVLGSRQPIIRRADLGGKGIYYRAQVGPFATADEANQVCGNLKTAGGQCIVQRN
jgi:SPOR domain